MNLKEFWSMNGKAFTMIMNWNYQLEAISPSSLITLLVVTGKVVVEELNSFRLYSEACVGSGGGCLVCPTHARQPEGACGVLELLQAVSGLFFRRVCSGFFVPGVKWVLTCGLGME